jgi:hypothetical protein
MRIPRVRNIIGSAGNPVANQFIISGVVCENGQKGTVFQSYGSVIVFSPGKCGEKTILDERYWDYSRTTGKYRNIFLGENKKETQRKIDDGTYILADLN